MKFAAALERALDRLSDPSFLLRIREEDPRMIRQLPILRSMNAAGFLTTNSQAAAGGDHRERAFVVGFMREAAAAVFIRDMGVLTDKVAVYVPVCPDDTHLPSSLDVPVTMSALRVHTHLSPALPREVWEQFRREARLDASERVVFVTCWDPVWGRPASSRRGLFTEIVRVLGGLYASHSCREK